MPPAEAQMAVSMHEAWLDILSVSPIPGLVFGAASDEDETSRPLLIANTAATCQLQSDAGRLQGITLRKLLQGIPVGWDVISTQLQSGCEWLVQESSVSIGRKPFTAAIILIPVTTFQAKGPVGYLALLLDPSMKAACSPHLTCVPGPGREQNEKAVLRRGLYAGTSEDVMPVDLAAVDAVLQDAHEKAMTRRYEGRQPMQAMPKALDVTAWITAFEVSLTEVCEQST
jgi:hypothetical protein